MVLRSLPRVRYDDTPDAFKARRPELSGLDVEFKGLHVTEMKADRQKRRVELWIAGYGNVDLGGDLIVPGAAAKTIEEDFPRDLIKFFWNHDFPLGPCELLEEHKDGLFMVGRVTEHADFDRYLAQIEDKTASHGSLGLSVRDAERMSAAQVKRDFGVEAGPHAMVRVIKAMRVWEGSAVIWPMNELVRVVQVKKGAQSMERKDLWDLASVIEAMARIRWLTSSEWAQIDDEEVEIAHQLVDEMASTTKKITEGLEHRELKANPSSESSTSIPPNGSPPLDVKSLIAAARKRAAAIEEL